MASGSQPTVNANGNELYSRAAAAEHARDFDTAFGLYLSAAQAHLHRARTLPAQRATERAKSKADAGTCLARAERIKAARRDSLKPLARDAFSKEEQTYILDKSSRVHGTLFPVWTDKNATVFSRDLDARLLPPLGADLLSLSPIWLHPSDVYGIKELSLAGSALHPHHIRQNVVTDCSVCSATAICLHHHRVFGSKLGLSCIFPHDAEGLPSISSDGIYTFRLFINGAFRKAIIDDRLPFTADGRPLSVMATSGNGDVDLWPVLLEKAYMKLMGGYDFPGSNSSVDIHTLTGWIPEHIEINGPTFVREEARRRICEGFNRGSCVLTLGTGARTNNSVLSVLALDRSQIRLLPTHSYAVLGIHGEADERWLTILNPWNTGLSIDDEAGVSDGLERMQIGDRDSFLDPGTTANDARYSESRNGRASASLVDVSWDDVCAVFDGLYLNWDPTLFRCNIDFHGSWRSKAGENTSQCVHYYLTLDLSSRSEETRSGRREQEHELWVLLSRHLVDKNRTGEFIAVHAVQLEREESGLEIGAVDTNLSLKGTYTNSTHTLARLMVTSPTARVALVASYDGPYADVSFSVQAFSGGTELAWVVQSRKSAYERSIEGTFSSRTAGGNSTHSTFMNNPQYRLRLHSENIGVVTDQPGVLGKMRKSLVRLIVEGPRNVPLNVMLIWRTEEESIERVLQLRPGDVIASSGPYSYGVAQAAASVTPGDYCIIVSTFEPRHRGNFTLRIESGVRLDLEDIPAEGAGMFCKTVKGAWQPGIDGGSPRFGSYDRNPMFEIDVRTATSLKLRLQLVKPSASIALNVTLFASSTRRPTPSTPPASSPPSYPPLSSNAVSSPNHTPFALNCQIVTSGAYVDGSSSPAGAVTPQTTIAPGRYIAVASTFDPGTHTAFQLLVFTKADVKVVSVLR